ncbi:hypothetical protein ACH4YO_36165 [Streptomyces noursei]|uniref:hypothetical protein n=1 Tax=Streptomyces noursei TaxID=1971 RepID=UPI0033E547AE
MASGMGVTVLTQSSTITTSVLVPFAGAGILTPAQVYPVVVGSNLGTTFTVVFAAFAGVGPDAKIGLQATFVHLLYNLFAIVVIYVIPLPTPCRCSAPRTSPASPPSTGGSSPSTSAPSSSHCPPWSSCWWAFSEDGVRRRSPSGLGALRCGRRRVRRPSEGSAAAPRRAAASRGWGRRGVVLDQAERAADLLRELGAGRIGGLLLGGDALLPASERAAARSDARRAAVAVASSPCAAGLRRRAGVGQASGPVRCRSGLAPSTARRRGCRGAVHSALSVQLSMLLAGACGHAKGARSWRAPWGWRRR